MKYKTERGMEVDLTEMDMKEISKMTDNGWDQQKFKDYLWNYHNKAMNNVQIISEENIDSEDDLKCALASVLKYGSTSDASDMIIESIEYMASKMMINSMKKECNY